MVRLTHGRPPDASAGTGRPGGEGGPGRLAGGVGSAVCPELLISMRLFLFRAVRLELRLPQCGVGGRASCRKVSAIFRIVLDGRRPGSHVEFRWRSANLLM